MRNMETGMPNEAFWRDCETEAVLLEAERREWEDSTDTATVPDNDAAAERCCW